MTEDEFPRWLRGAEGAQRRERSARIADVDDVLADLYLQACEFVERPTSAISMSMLGHSMRELLNGLAAGLADVEGVELPDRHNESGQIRELVSAWEASGLAAEEGPEHLEQVDSVRPIPTAVYRAAQAVVRGQRTVSVNSCTRLAQIAGSGADPAAPISRQLKRTYDFFMDWCHVKRGSPRSLPSEDEVRSEMEQVESIIDVRLSSFFDIKSDLDDILRVTNQPITRASEETRS